MRILVRAPNWLGDIIMSVGFFIKLTELFPKCEIHVIIKDKLSDIMILFPQVSQIYPFPKDKYKGFRGIYRFAKEILKNDSFDIFFSLPDSFSSALMGYFIKNKMRIGYRKEFRSPLLTKSYKKPSGLHRVEEYAFLLSDFSSDALRNLSIRLEIPTHNQPIGPDLPDNAVRILLNVNSEASSRRVPLQKAGSIAKSLIKHFDCLIIFTGIAKDKQYILELMRLIDAPEKIVNLTGKTSLLELAAVIMTVDLMISTDSGPSHFANSLGTNLLILGGPADDRNTGPYEKNNYRIVRADDIPCAPCVKNECPYGTSQCLLDIKEDAIIKNVVQLLN